jgi:hypothetical protein
LDLFDNFKSFLGSELDLVSLVGFSLLFLLCDGDLSLLLVIVLLDFGLEGKIEPLGIFSSLLDLSFLIS